MGQLPVQRIDPRAIDIPVSMFQLPVLGGQLEMTQGIQPHAFEIEGLYSQKPSGFSVGDGLPKQMIAYEDTRVGWMSWSVTSYKRNGSNAYLLQTEGTYKQEMKMNRGLALVDSTNHMKRSYWISKQGNLLETSCTIELPRQRWSMNAVFNKDGYDLYMSNPGGERHTTVNVPFDVSMFDAAFTPMIKGKEVVLREKEFYAVSPITGAPIKYKAKVMGHFKAHWFGNNLYTGQYVDIEDEKGGSHQRVYVSDEGSLMRVETPNNKYLNIEQRPEKNDLKVDH